jgi:ribonucleoside-triphosphate reductase
MRTIDNIRRFRLSDTFMDPYREAEVPWGPLGYITFKRTYARRLNEFDPEATGTEEWWQTCRRVVEGMFNMQKQHVFQLGLGVERSKGTKNS